MFFRLIGALGYTVRTHKSFLWYKDQLWNPIHKISHCRGCRVQCRVTKIVPLVHKPTLVSYKNVPSIIVRSKQSLKAPKSQISLSGIFFETPCTLYCTTLHYTTLHFTTLQYNTPLHCTGCLKKMPDSEI